VLPEIFEKYKMIAIGLGFKHVESGPLVRSSYLLIKYLTLIARNNV
jgi:lipoic acid synthetase